MAHEVQEASAPRPDAVAQTSALRQSNAVQPNAAELVLPTQISGLAEVRRLARELAALDDYMQAARIRQGGEAQTAPQASRMLDALASDNSLNLLKQEDRDTLRAFLAQLQQRAPTVHISFAVDPPVAALNKIVAWLRANVHPLVLVQVGLQPTITAGCVLRTPNKVFDMSLRQRFEDKRQDLMTALDKTAEQSDSAQSTPVAATQSEAVA